VTLLNRIQIAQKLALAFGVTLACCLLLGGFSLGQLSSVNHAAGQMANHYMPSARLLATMDSRLNAMRRVALREIEAGNNLQEFRAQESRMEKLDKDFTEAQKEYEPFVESSQEHEFYDQFKEKLSTYKAAMVRTNQLQEQGKLAEAAVLSKTLGLESFTSLSDALNAGIKSTTDQGTAFAKAAAQKYDNAKLLILLLLTVSVALSLILSVIITRNITVPLKRAAEMLGKVAEGDLTHNLEVTSQDEIGALTDSLNHTVESLRVLLATVSENATQLAAASEEISASASHSSESAHRQSDQTAQVSTAMQEMSATVTEVSDNSRRAADAAREASDTARTGGKVVSETLTTMRSIAGSTTAVAAKITELGKSSQRIGTIAAVIDDIADQTNLLALNAAIEAARAGEQGRGFAVVADEVRKLAERTAAATKEIAGMIESIQKEAREAVAAMQGGSREVELGVTKTEGSGKALDQIIEMASRVGDMVAQIATAATEQSATAEQVNANISNIAEMTSQSSINAGETAKACTDLSNLAFNLQTLVGNFKLNRSSEHPANSYRRTPPSPVRSERDDFSSRDLGIVQ
jgi:methyl-accepting chemotaxis protein